MVSNLLLFFASQTLQKQYTKVRCVYNRQMPKLQIVIHEPPTIQINIEILIRKRKKKYIFNTNSSNLLSSFFLQTYLLSTLTLWWYNKAPFILYMYMFGPDQARHANIPIRYLLCFLFQFESPSNIIQATYIVLCLRSFDYTLSPQLRSTILFWDLIKNIFFIEYRCSIARSYRQ